MPQEPQLLIGAHLFSLAPPPIVLLKSRLSKRSPPRPQILFILGMCVYMCSNLEKSGNWAYRLNPLANLLLFPLPLD